MERLQLTDRVSRSKARGSSPGWGIDEIAIRDRHDAFFLLVAAAALVGRRRYRRSAGHSRFSSDRGVHAERSADSGEYGSRFIANGSSGRSMRRQGSGRTLHIPHVSMAETWGLGWGLGQVFPPSSSLCLPESAYRPAHRHSAYTEIIADFPHAVGAAPVRFRHRFPPVGVLFGIKLERFRWSPPLRFRNVLQGTLTRNMALHALDKGFCPQVNLIRQLLPGTLFILPFFPSPTNRRNAATA